VTCTWDNSVPGFCYILLRLRFSVTGAFLAILHLLQVCKCCTSVTPENHCLLHLFNSLCYTSLLPVLSTCCTTSLLSTLHWLRNLYTCCTMHIFAGLHLITLPQQCSPLHLFCTSVPLPNFFFTCTPAAS
jgi:hypothetical protein